MRGVLLLCLVGSPLWGSRFAAQVGWALPGGVMGTQTKFGQVFELQLQEKDGWLTRGLSLYFSTYEGLGSGRYRVRTAEISPWVGLFPEQSGFFLRTGIGLGVMDRSLLGGRERGALFALFGGLGFLGHPVPPLGLSLELSGRVYLSQKPLWVLGWTAGVFVPWP